MTTEETVLLARIKRETKAREAAIAALRAEIPSLTDTQALIKSLRNRLTNVDEQITTQSLELDNARAEIEFGNWSDQSLGTCTGNVVQRIRRQDGKPVRYAGRFGCLPKFVDSNVRHIWWLSIGITFYYWGKYAARSLATAITRFSLVKGNNQ